MRALRLAIAVALVLSGSACGGDSEGTGLLPGSSVQSVTGTSASARAGFDDLVRGIENGENNACTRGEPVCIDAVIAEMRTRFDRLVAACDHLAPWALEYLRTTEGVHTLLTTPGAVKDPAFVTELDARFAALYFRAYDNWHGGNKGDVPPAWRSAFAAADDEAVTALGNMVLGSNAHISGDLPLALVSTGLPPDGSGQHADFEAVNQVLRDAIVPTLTEIGQRFDPTVARVALPGVAVGKEGVIELLASWRESAFADGERLSGAGAARPMLEAQLADVAGAKALPVRVASSYLPFTGAARQRDDYCKQHGGG